MHRNEYNRKRVNEGLFKTIVGNIYICYYSGDYCFGVYSFWLRYLNVCPGAINSGAIRSRVYLCATCRAKSEQSKLSGAPEGQPISPWMLQHGSMSCGGAAWGTKKLQHGDSWQAAPLCPSQRGQHLHICCCTQKALQQGNTTLLCSLVVLCSLIGAQM